jgi:hypothetical protein
MKLSKTIKVGITEEQISIVVMPVVKSCCSEALKRGYKVSPRIGTPLHVVNHTNHISINRPYEEKNESVSGIYT